MKTMPGKTCRGLLLSSLLCTILLLTLSLQQVAAGAEPPRPPQLNGSHYVITVVKTGDFLDVEQSNTTNRLSYSGYLISMLKAIARRDRANFTYELRTPSGYGPSCVPRIEGHTNFSVSGLDTTKPPPAAEHPEPYSDAYFYQYNCAADDVNDLTIRRSGSHGTDHDIASDMYWGMFYVTPDRQLQNHFTIPFQPPRTGAPGMVGTAVRVRDFPDLVRQQADGLQKPACINTAAAYSTFVQESYPDLQLEHITFRRSQDVIDAFEEGKCDIFITPLPEILVYGRFQKGSCLVNGMPIGVIGDPMPFGLSHYAIGIGKHLNRTVVETISYWMNILMTCSPANPMGQCPEGNLASMYITQSGSGRECGYVQFPPERGGWPWQAIVGIVLGAVGLSLLIYTVWHHHQMGRQEKRFKKRFVQQIARNIEIGPSPGHIPPDKLAQEVLHIGNHQGVIAKDDLQHWLHDIKMEFISARDFDALWNAMDLDGKGYVDPVEFVVFLSACGPEFEEVYEEQQKLPKLERLKLAARRLTNIAAVGEEGVLKLERKLDRSSRAMEPCKVKSSGTSRTMDDPPSPSIPAFGGVPRQQTDRTSAISNQSSLGSSFNSGITVFRASSSSQL